MVRIRPKIKHYWSYEAENYVPIDEVGLIGGLEGCETTFVKCKAKHYSYYPDWLTGEIRFFHFWFNDLKQHMEISNDSDEQTNQEN